MTCPGISTGPGGFLGVRPHPPVLKTPQVLQSRVWVAQRPPRGGGGAVRLAGGGAA